MGALNNSPVIADGFLSEGACWDRTIAEELARINGIGPLTEDHWKVIDFARKYYLEHGVGPTAYKIYKATGFRLQPLFELFPGAITWNVHCIAGLPHPVKESLKKPQDEVGEMRMEPQRKEGKAIGQEVLSGIIAKPEGFWQLAHIKKAQWAVALVMAIISGTMIFKILKLNEDMQSFALVPMIRVEATVGKGLVEVPLDAVKKKKLVSFEYKQLDGLVPLLAYTTPSGSIVTAIGLFDPCNSKSFHIEGGEIVCDLCLTRWDLETLRGVSGECLEHPLERVPHTVQDGRLAIREVDIREWKPPTMRG